jgi:hypothetical protein
LWHYYYYYYYYYYYHHHHHHHHHLSSPFSFAVKSCIFSILKEFMGFKVLL